LKEVYQEGTILPEGAKLQMLRNYAAPMILISASGDMDRGKSEQLLPKMIGRQNVFIMIVNYVSPGSNAGLLLNNKRTHSGLKSMAKIKKYDVFSDHANLNRLQKWLSNQDKNVELYIVHSSEKNAQDVIKILKSEGWQKTNGTKIGGIIKIK
jgi:metallo-beta-lactamase family protein